jgi:luciferase family oxidoreductase group 1
VGWLRDRLPEGHPFRGVRAEPSGPTAPEIWLLGSSDASAIYAAEQGLAFSFAHFINGEGGPQVTELYRRRFQPSPELAAPLASAAIWVVCADTDEEARRLEKSRQLALLRLYTGRYGPFPSVEEAESFPYTERDLAIIDSTRNRTIAGTPETVREQMEQMARAYEVDELVVVTITHDFKARVRSYELLAEAFGLHKGSAE